MSHSVLFQLTRPRGTRRISHPQHDSRIGVSTHASAWDATCRRQNLSAANKVSTHASAWDATSIRRDNTKMRTFQLTRPRGTRPGCITLHLPHRVSTHASAWDATLLERREPSLGAFQLTRPRGTRRSPILRSRRITKFQLTRPRGTRRVGGI